MKQNWQYALITKHRTPHIIILSDTNEDFEKAIDTFYWNKKGLAPKDSIYTKEDCLREYLKTRICIIPFESTSQQKLEEG